MIGGSVLVLIQARGVSDRRTWIGTGIAAWVVLSVLLGVAYERGWHAAGDLSLFAGYRELASFASLLAGYGIATRPPATPPPAP